VKPEEHNGASGPQRNGGAKRNRHHDDLHYGLSASEIARRIDPKARRQGKAFRVRCLAHGGEDPNLAIADGEKGVPVFKCYSRDCSFEEIRAALATQFGIGIGPPPNTGENRERKPRGGIAALLREGYKQVAVYPYTDEAGKPLYEKIKFERRNGVLIKTYRFRRPHGRGGWIESLGDVRRVPYRLSDVIAKAGQILQDCEGEKDADRLAQLGLRATSLDELNKVDLSFIRGESVNVYEDNDVEGAGMRSGAPRLTIGRSQ